MLFSKTNNAQQMVRDAKARDLKITQAFASRGRTRVYFLIDETAASMIASADRVDDLVKFVADALQVRKEG